MGARFIWITGRPGAQIQSREVSLEGGREWVFGRHPDCDVVLDERIVSSRHARFRFEADDRLVVEDLGSRNGTHVVRDGEEIPLEAQAPWPLAPEEAVRIGPYLLMTAERLGEGVHLTGATMAEPGTLSAFTESQSQEAGGAQPDAKPSQDGATSLAHALHRALAACPRRRAWTPMLEALCELALARAGFLLVQSPRGFVLKASRGQDGPTCLSQTFIEMTAQRSSTWTIVPGQQGPKELASRHSILAYAEGIRLSGVPFPDRQGGVIAVGYLEHDAMQATVPGSLLDMFAQATGPVIDDLLMLDREIRRREAADKRLGRRGEAQQRSDPDHEHQHELPALIGDSRAFREAVASIERAAPSSAALLIRGPSGSGKEGLVRLAHLKGERRDGPLVALNCAAIPESLAESELFGHVKGAFTGAERARDGAFVQADGGTLFLDEVGDLPLSLQAKLLRVIETGEVLPLGGTVQQVDVRVVSATHRDLAKLVEEGRFREDLFYRLSVITVELPPLSDRAEDVVPLAEHFLQLLARGRGHGVSGISARAARALAHYRWAGNVRELRNVVERAVVLDTDGVLDLDDLPADIASAFDVRDGPTSDLLEEIMSLPWEQAKARVDAAYFQRALDEAGGKVGEAAKATGITRRALSTKIKEYGLKTKRA